MSDEEKKVPGSDEETPETPEESTPDAPEEEEAAEVEAEEVEAEEEVQEAEPEPAPEPEKPRENVMDDVKAFLSSDPDEGRPIDFDADMGGEDDLDDLMANRRGNVSLVLFLIGLAIILGVLGYILVNEEAKSKVAAFIRGDLFSLEKQRAEDLQTMYHEKMELLGEKYGDIRLQYFPRNAKVHIYQTMFRYDDINDKSAEAWGDPKEIPNMTLDLKEGEELPYLSIENLPVREKGKMCLSNGQFYPASQQFCPGHEACKEQMGKGGEEANETCIKNALKSVQFCAQDEKYYTEETGGVMVCEDGKTLMDPSRVPIFVFRYDFLFETKDFIPQVVSYAENDWIHLGSGKYIIPFPKDFALLRAWGPLKKKYASVREKMRCWRVTWDDEWEDLKRGKVLTLVREKIAEAAKEKEEKTHIFRQKRAQFTKSLLAVDIVRKVKVMATIRNGAAEIFWYCPELGKCDPAKMQELIKTSGKQTVAELDEFEKGLYYGALYGMKNSTKKWDGMEEYLATQPVAKAGLTCLQEYIAKQKEGSFVPAKGKDCLEGLAAIQSADPYAYNAFQTMFIDQNANAAVLLANKADIDNYLLSVDEYEGGEKYDDLVFRIESSGKFLEYLILAIMYDYKAFNDAMIRFARSRLVNYRRDCEKRGVIPSDVFRGMKDAMELAWWTGSRVAFDEWYFRLWSQDVQGCLLFAKENDEARYVRDLAKFEDMVGAEKKGLREQAKGFKDFLNSVRAFAKARPALKEANALYRKDRKAFYNLYPETEMERLKTESPEFYWGLLYLSNPRSGRDHFTELSKLPEVQSWEVPKKEGDQKSFHKYLAYMEVFAPEKLEKGMAALRERMVPMFLTKLEYELLRDEKPDMPTYNQAIRDIVANDIHLKYFWLVKLIDSPSMFDREFKKLELAEAKEVSKWIDPKRYAYLSDLIWMKEMVSRYGDSVPMLTDALTIDFGLYGEQQKKLRNWSIAKSKILKKYKRGKKLSASLLKEPSNVAKAMDKALKMANRYALLAKNIQDYEEAVLSTHMANAMEELREEMDGGQRDSYARHIELHNEKLRLAVGLTKKEWESLTKEFEMTAANAEWYSYLSESLKERRLDCSKIQGFEPPADWKKEIRGEGEEAAE